MRGNQFSRACGTAALLCLPCLVQAQDAPPDNGVVMLPCDGKCATVSRNPIHKSGGLGAIPQQGTPGAARYTNTKDGEGVLELQFTILPDGHVADDISVLRQLGPPEFVDSAKRSIQGWTYEPAMVDGKPVAVSHRLRVIFNLGEDRSIRKSLADDYGAAAGLLKAGKLEEARAKLKETLSQPRLNFYERGMVAYLLTLTDMQRGDFVEARIEAGLAMMFPDDSMPKSVSQSIFRNYILACLDLGDVVGAVKALDIYKNTSFFNSSETLAKEAETLRKKLDPLPTFGVDARIPAREDADGFAMYLYRRYFAFAKVSGKLDGFTLSCKEQESSSPYSDSAEWSVPKDWSDCSLLVKGSPGTTFQLVQYAAPASAR
jgi:hypothetical protein